MKCPAASVLRAEGGNEAVASVAPLAVLCQCTCHFSIAKGVGDKC
jgi:hypothetical protein